jgi:SWI/SNF-related matrix-associated actin-dependent regulator of chromatin subfamily D
MSKKKPHDKNLNFLHEPSPFKTVYSPLQIEESKLFSQLQHLECKLDSLLVRKRLDIQEALSRPSKQTKILRLFISHTTSDQYISLQDDNSNALMEDRLPSWTLQIQGKLLDSSLRASTRKRMTSFFKSIFVQLERDSEIYPYGNLIEWHKSNLVASDGLEIKRLGDENVEAKILLYLDHTPEKYNLSSELSSLLSINNPESKQSIILALWQYIKIHRLQSKNDPRIITPNAALSAVLGASPIPFTSIPEVISSHLTLTDPITIPYTIAVDVPSGSACYDIKVEVEDPVRDTMMSIVGGGGKQKEISNLDDQISQIISRIRLHKSKREFMGSFYRDPVNFLNQLIKIQSMNSEVVYGPHTLTGDQVKRQSFYKENWVNDAVYHYLSSKK